jgi:hypothetical protein
MRVRRRGSSAKQHRSPDSQPDTRRAEVRASVVRCFDAWRDAAYDVEVASRRWRTALPDDWEAAASGFFAALEREEKAATEYERAWRAWRRAPGLSAAPR